MLIIQIMKKTLSNDVRIPSGGIEKDNTWRIHNQGGGTKFLGL